MEAGGTIYNCGKNYSYQELCEANYSSNEDNYAEFSCSFISSSIGTKKKKKEI